MNKSISLGDYNNIKPLKPHSNLDSWYGPYYIGEDTSIDRTFSTIEDIESFVKPHAEVGLTIGIVEDDRLILEYLFQYDDNNELVLTEKGLNLKLKLIILLKDPQQSEDSDSTVRLSYAAKVSSIFGNNAIKLYYSRDGGFWTLYSQRDFQKNGELFIIKNLETGEYSFRITLTDIFGASIEHVLNNIVIGLYSLEYNIDQVITLNKIRTITNLSNIRISYKIKIYDTINISPNDFHFFLNLNLLSTTVTANGSEHWVTLNSSFFNESTTGGWLYIGTASNKKRLFSILGSNTLNAVCLKSSGEFYLGVEESVVFEFESGASNMYITSAGDSDFTIDGTVVLNNFNPNTGKETITLRITPKQILKNNAKIIFKFSSNESELNNSTNTEEVVLGNIKELENIDRNAEWPTNSLINIHSFYLDFSAILHKTEESSKLLTINNDIYIDNDIIKVGELETITPIESGEVYIGIGYQLRDNNPNLGETAVYNCICINGVVVAVKKINNPTNTSINLEIDNNIIFKSRGGNECKGIWYKTGDSYLNLVTNPNSLQVLCEQHYNYDFSPIQKTLPTLKLEAKRFVSGVNFDKVWKSQPTEALFGSLSDGATKSRTESDFNLSGNKLLKMSTELKKKCLKKYAVLCEYTYNDGNEESLDIKGDVLVYTLGTSTLNYPLPNFKLFFQKNLPFGLEVDTKIFSELMVTLKADYMESSHLNNTPTAMLFNKSVLKLAEENTAGNIVFEVSPPINIMLNNPNNTVNYSDAIVGTPIVLEIKDIGGNLSNYGSFMLNTDKVSDSLGFKCYGEDYKSMSFEGTTNFADGSAARFFYDERSADGSEIHEGYNGNLEDITNIVNSNWDEEFDSLWETHKNAIAKYLSRGFEFRFPESVDFLEDDNTTINASAELYLKEFFKMWRDISLLNDITEGTQSEIDLLKKQIIEKYFNIDYCKLYIIFLIVFALSDNLGKNCMFDCWEIPDGSSKKWGKWYPRPYDLDSINGLTNGGVENIPPFAFVSPRWLTSINTSIGREDTFRYKKYNSKIYRYSSENSVLWENIYLLYKDDIKTMYLKLRESLFNTENLITYYLNTIINKISIAQYNIDFLNKYVASPQMEFMYGNRWTSFKDWITARLSFCDSFFEGYKADIQGTAGAQGISFNIEYLFPAFYTRRNEVGEESFSLFEKTIWDQAPTGLVHYIISLADDLIKSSNIFLYNIFDRATFGNPEWNLVSQKSLEINSKIYPKINEMELLENLVIGETASLSDYDLIVPNSVKTLTIKSLVKSLSFSTGSNLQECLLENINISEISFINCENLHLLNLKDVNITSSLTLLNSNLNLTILGNSEIESLIITGGSYESLMLKNLNFSSVAISGNPVIKVLDLYGSTISNLILDLSSVSYDTNFTLNIIKSNILKVKVSNNFKDISNLKLGVLESELIGFSTEDNSNNNYIDLDLFAYISGKTKESIVYADDEVTTKEPINKITNILVEDGVYKTQLSDSSKTSLEHSGICFGLTPISKAKISKGLTVSGYCLFAKCNLLNSVEVKSNASSNDAILSSHFIFYDCPLLSSLPNRLKLSKFKGAFIGTAVNWNTAFGSIYDDASSDTNFDYFYCYVNPLNSEFTVDFSSIHYLKPTSIVGMFFNGYEGGKFIYSDPRYYRITESSSVDYTKDRPITQYKITVNNLFNELLNSLNLVFSTLNVSRNQETNDDELNWNADVGRALITLNLNTLNNIINSNSVSIFNGITSAVRTFLNCNVLFDSSTKNPVYFINKILDNNKLTSIKGMFAGCRFLWSNLLDFVEDHYLISLNGSTKLIDVDSVFWDSYFGKIQSNYQTYFYIDNFVKNLLGNDGTRNISGSSGISNRNLNIEGCFYNCPNALINENLNISSSILKVYMGGIIGLASLNGNIPKIPIFWSNKFEIRNTIMVPTGSYALTTNNYFTYVYPFKNRKVKMVEGLSSLDLSGNSILCYCGFIYTGDANIITINISGTSSLDRICRGASNVKVNVSELLSNCSGIEAFRECSFDNTSLFSFTNLTNASMMFMNNSSLQKINFTIPDVQDATDMFRNCKNLKGGLPNNFFGSVSKLQIATRMFYMTLITRKIIEETRENIVLPSTITNAEGMFARTKVKGVNSESYSVTIKCLSNSDISGIFASSYIPIDKINFGGGNLGANLVANYALVNLAKDGTIWSNIKANLNLAKGLWAHETFYSEEPFDTIPPNIQIGSDTMFAGWTGVTVPSSFSINSEYTDDISDWAVID